MALTTAVLASVFGFFAFLCLGAVRAEYCGYTSYPYDSTWCTYGCCGYSPNEYCCDTTVLTVWAIVGIVIGCIIVISIVIALVCCCIKTQGKSGRVVQPHGQPPANQPNVTVLYAGSGGYAAPPGPSYGMGGGGHPSAPGPYHDKPPVYPPPPAYYSDPAYPPTGSNPAGTGSGPAAPPDPFTVPPSATAPPQ